MSPITVVSITLLCRREGLPRNLEQNGGITSGTPCCEPASNWAARIVATEALQLRLAQRTGDGQARCPNRRKQPAQQAQRRGPENGIHEQRRRDREGKSNLAERLPVDRR